MYFSNTCAIIAYDFRYRVQINTDTNTNLATLHSLNGSSTLIKERKEITGLLLGVHFIKRKIFLKDSRRFQLLSRLYKQKFYSINLSVKSFATLSYHLAFS